MQVRCHRDPAPGAIALLSRGQESKTSPEESALRPGDRGWVGWVGCAGTVKEGGGLSRLTLFLGPGFFLLLGPRAHLVFWRSVRPDRFRHVQRSNLRLVRPGTRKVIFMC